MGGGEPQDIFLLVQDGDADPYWHLYYCLLPSVVHNNQNFPGEGWRISSDDGKLDLTPEELQSELIENYDIFLIWTVDDYFCSKFSGIFSDPYSIADQSIYKINKETRLLELVNGE